MNLINTSNIKLKDIGVSTSENNLIVIGKSFIEFCKENNIIILYSGSDKYILKNNTIKYILPCTLDKVEYPNNIFEYTRCIDFDNIKILEE